MTIWLLALVLLASLAGIGYRQGVIRVGFSLVGILLGALLAVPLGRFLRPLLVAVGLKNPVLAWLLGPFIVFCVVSIVFKIVALNVHQKVDVKFRYHAGDLRLALWERLSHRLGMCLGLVNGAVYLFLISFVIYALSYWTVQMATSDTDPRTLQLLNRLGRDLQSSGFARVAGAVSGLPASYYDTADIAGLIYNNSLLEARLSRYPGLLGAAERPELQDLASDTEFTKMRLQREPVMNVLNYPKAEAILKNPELLRSIWATLVPDAQDLRAFLETGRSARYDGEKLLGRWNFDVNFAMKAVREKRPNLPSSEMQKIKKVMVAAFARTSFIATPDHQAILKNVPRTMTPAGPVPGDIQTVQGQWKGADGKYDMSFQGGVGEVIGTLEGDRLALTGASALVAGSGLSFTREN
jgi:hypothetical protein